MARKQRKPLTDLKVQSLGPGRYGDGQGLYLEVKSSGTRSWCLIYQIGGKRRQMGLGPYPEVSLADARFRAAEKRLLIKRDKIDPLRLEGGRKASQRTFAEYAEEFIAHREPHWRNKKSPDQWRSTIDEYVNPHIGSKPVRDITSDDVYRLLTRNSLWENKNETASRVRGRIKRILDYAAAHGAQIAKNPADWEGNLRERLPDVKKVRERFDTRLRSLPYRLAKEFLAELAARKEMSAKAMTWALLTACRTGNIRTMTWDQLDFDQKLWICPAATMKTNVEHRVPLSDEQVNWIKEIPRLGDFVFTGGRRNKPISDNTLLALLRRMNYLDQTTTHGLRATFSTWANDRTNYQNDIIEAALAHKIGNKTAQAYNRSDLLAKRRNLMLDWQRYLGFSPSIEAVEDGKLESELKKSAA